jgi:hypothetical protein
VKVLRAGLSNGLGGRALALYCERLKCLRILDHRERSLDKLPFLLPTIGTSKAVKKVASHLAQPCG